MNLFLLFILGSLITYGIIVSLLNREDKMDCKIFSDSIEAYINDGLSSNEANMFREHMAECEDCSEDFEDSKYMNELFKIVKESSILSPERKETIYQRIVKKLKGSKD